MLLGAKGSAAAPLPAESSLLDACSASATDLAPPRAANVNVQAVALGLLPGDRPADSPVDPALMSPPRSRATTRLGSWCAVEPMEEGMTEAVELPVAPTPTTGQVPAPNARAGPKQEGGGPAADMPTAPSLPQLNTTWLSDQALGDALASLSMSPMPQRQLSNEGAGPWAAALHPSPVFAPALPAARDAFPLARSNSAPASVPGNWQPEGGHWPSGPPALSLQAVDAAPPWAQGLGTWPAAAAAAPPGTQPRRLSAAAAALPAFSPVPRSAAAPHAASAAAPPPAPLPAPAAAGRHVSAAREEAEARSGGQEADQDGDDEEEAAEEEEEEDEEEEEGSEYGAEGASPEHAYLASINMMGMPRHQAAAVAALVAAAARFQPPQAPYAPRGAPSPRADGMLPPPLPPGSHPPPLPPSHGYMRYPPAMHAMGHAPPLPPPPPPSGYGAVPPLHLAYSPYVQHMAYPPRHAGIRPPYPLPVPPGPMSPVVARGPEGHRGYPPASSPRQAPSDDSPPSGDGRHVAAEATAARGAAGVQRGVGKLTPSRSRRTPAAATGAASRSPLAGPRSHAASMDTASQEDGQSDAEEGVRSRVDRTRTRTRTRSSASTSSAHAAGPQTYFEVEFKRGRRHWFAWEGDNNGPDEMSVGDMVKVDADRGSDVGRVTRVAAELPPARGDNVAQRVKRLLRKARSDEVAHMPHKESLEKQALQFCASRVQDRALPMQVIDAEFQYDNRKLTFFFRAERRIDFRELVRDLFSEYRTRIWMQQVS